LLARLRIPVAPASVNAENPREDDEAGKHFLPDGARQPMMRRTDAKMSSKCKSMSLELKQTNGIN
jgi:hypothetical protein